MAINIAQRKASTEPDVPAAYRVFGINADWEERIITAVAASVAVLIVAAVAVLMGMV